MKPIHFGTIMQTWQTLRGRTARAVTDAFESLIWTVLVIGLFVLILTALLWATLPRFGTDRKSASRTLRPVFVGVSMALCSYSRRGLGHLFGRCSTRLRAHKKPHG